MSIYKKKWSMNTLHTDRHDAHFQYSVVKHLILCPDFQSSTWHSVPQYLTVWHLEHADNPSTFIHTTQSACPRIPPSDCARSVARDWLPMTPGPCLRALSTFMRRSICARWIGSIWGYDDPACIAWTLVRTASRMPLSMQARLSSPISILHHTSMW